MEYLRVYFDEFSEIGGLNAPYSIFDC